VDASKIALGGVAGLVLGALLGSIGAVMMTLKVVRKLITFH
jgi:hypothetical protein